VLATRGLTTYGHCVKQRALIAVAVLCLAATAACGSSSTTGTTPSTPVTTTPPSSSAAPTSAAPTSAPPPSTGGPTPSPSSTVTGKSATCVNGWTDAPAGSDFFTQAQQAVQDTLKAAHPVKTVRYFAGPLVAGGIGAVYYVKLADPQLAVRMVIVSGGGPSKYAVAPSGTHGWTDGQWTGFSGTEAPSAHPPLPGTWAGPAYDPVSGSAPLLSPQLAGCLAGT
jgi:hypothetical protein